ncbi:eukaryotic translation initiation factor 2C [Exidia glandulosa HHB12029]|uniref:Eukaryotic translation initiation factor 2C n=1 Tax=Exidia glandulosa HHB12029 TaxID=1314781 RepID=A0A165QYQ9_EXIGL|nr:eukaryotic translation initiation factor 2C [Exidia glandulosa HHB12029]
MPPRGGPGSRGGPPSSRGGRGGAIPVGPTGGIPSHVQTIGVRRPGVGSAGRKLNVVTNHFGVTIPDGIIHHYDVIDNNADKTFPARLNMEIIIKLQNLVAPDVFTPRVVYDGRKNIFSPRALPFGASAEATLWLTALPTQFAVPLGTPPAGRPGKAYRVRLTKVAEINPEILARFLQGRQSHESVVLTAITALNVVIRMAPSMLYPFNVRSFFTPRETKDIGAGIVLWRGYFQSVRPAVGRMLVNIDISTGTMYKPGILYPIAMDIMGFNDPGQLYAGKFTDRDAVKLSRFLSGVRVLSVLDKTKPPRTVKRVLANENASKTFTLQVEGQAPRTISIAQYFKDTFNRDLRHPRAVLVELGKGAYVPLELLEVPPGQIMKKTVPPEKTKDVLEFATKKPADRLKSIMGGLEVLNYSQSQFLNSFNMQVSEGALRTGARVLVPPTLKYGPGSKQVSITPRDGAWNMIDKKFFIPGKVTAWAVIVYERQQRFNQETVRNMIEGMRNSAREVGINGFDSEPVVVWENGQGRIADQLRAVGGMVKQKFNTLPTLLVCILPEGSTNIYNAIKHFGDITAGVATQCMKSAKCFKAKPQYYANVLLNCCRVNVKLGGVNTVPDDRSVPFLTDPTNPVLILGADVIHPAPGSEGRPSFTSIVGNVDGAVSKYVATSRVQTSRKEIIEDMQEMTQHILGMYYKYRINMEKKSGVPKRVVLYRDGVSEGQFQTVLDEEVPQLKAAFAAMKISPPPKLTVIVVGKRHHVRMFPESSKDADKSGNCPSGTVIDTDIVHPTEFDFYLQSHGGLLGTSRPAHYNVLYDENNFTPDALQQLSFALCHVFARSTRAVSIPAPVYYADIVCARARTHYDPSVQDKLAFSDDQTGTGSGQGSAQLQRYKENFKPLHQATALTMYFN